MSNIQRRPDGKWRARYRDAVGKEHSRHFGRKVDGQRWLDMTTTALVTGTYVQPNAGKVTFRDYAERWRVGRVHRPGTAKHIKGALARHVYPVIGSRPLESILPCELQAMVTGIALSPSSTRVTWRYVSAIFKAAVLDKRIMTSPCQGVKLPRVERHQVEVVDAETVWATVDAMPERLQCMVIAAGGTGMRQGELFGVALDRVDFLRRTVRVDRQIVDGGVFGPPKTDASVRTIPLPQSVVDALAVHLRTFPAGDLGLVFARPSGQPWSRSAFAEWWGKARLASGTDSKVTMHSLRHFYASLLIRHGESVKVVQSRLGHATAAETLDTYSHLWPDSEDRTRDAVDAVLGIPADSLRTRPGD